MEVADNKFHRLKPGGEVRLRYGYVIRCDKVEKDAAGIVQKLVCSADLATLGKNPEGRKVKGVIHWLEAKHAVAVEVRHYERLMSQPQVSSDDMMSCLRSDSVRVQKAWVEPDICQSPPETTVQFERIGYFVFDRKLCQNGKIVLNSTVSLKDSSGK